MDLLLSSSLAWSTTTQSAFESLKHAIAQLPVLLFSDFTLPFDVTTNASQIAMAALLSQQDRPIAFFTKKLSPQLQDFFTFFPADREFITSLQACTASSCHFSYRAWLVFYKQRVFMPLKSGLGPSLIGEFHSMSFEGHSGVKAMLARLSATHGV
ncbi:UNVERIFIED_CONTAM: Retrovirus-related Pol polyprotein from transposon.6 [Sesamum radiatum]|uniref:Retrovirus-related Pol polyprotein from transposon.6 n=1 Tax=Sesamum radiatum TaxID=300843 RepID=A0AAW2L8X3_SESRA